MSGSVANFRYKAIAGSGELVHGRMEAQDSEQVYRRLRGQGHLPVEALADESAVSPLRAFRRRRRPAGLRDLAVVTRELVMLLGAGQTLERALKLLVESSAPDSLRPSLGRALAALQGGSTLADGLETAGGFSPLYLAMVRAGESGGALEAVLTKLADLLERSARLQEALVSALIYPIILVAVAVCSVVLLLTVVVPQFAPLFANARHALPLATRLVLACSAGLRQWGVPSLFALLLILLAGPPLVRRLPLQDWRDARLLRLPGLGALLAMAATARLMRTLGVLLRSGVALPTALSLVRGVAGNRVFARVITAMRDGVKNGRSLADSVPADSPLPALALQLMRVGEQSGHLDEILVHVADILDSKVELTLKRFVAAFEPACVLVLSAVVGSIVVSILLAVVSINDLAL